MRKLFFPFWGLLLVCLGISCTSRLALPDKSFAEVNLPGPPDYSLDQNWAALPGKSDSADITPPGVSPENQAQAPADVFFIYPTIFEKGGAWNADLEDIELNQQIDRTTIRHQTTPFNASCKVYAPRYRQMVLGGFYPKSRQDSLDKEKALNLAYQDVKKAFEYYLEHYHQDRPIVIAAHSQGSYHAVRLLRDFFDENSLADKLVVAYVLGWPVREAEFDDLNACEDSGQTGCVVSWATWKKKTRFNQNRKAFYQNVIVINPLTWTSDTEVAPATLHKGLLKGDFKTFKRNFSAVEIENNVLWVKNPVSPIPVKNYHIADVNYFWLDIRENVAERIGVFLENE